MTALSKLYGDFQAAVMEGDFARAVPSLTDGKLSPEQQLAIYRDGYRARLQNALQRAYEASAALMDESFTVLAGSYIDTHPPTGPNLDLYPLGFAAFVAPQSSHPFYGDMLRIEQGINESYWAFDAESLSGYSFNNLGNEELEKARLSLVPSARVLRFDYPVDEWFTAWREGRQLPIPEAAKEYLLVMRVGRQVQRYPLTVAGYRLLSALQSGATVGEAIVASGASAEELQRWFAEWMELGLFMTAKN